MKKPSYLEIYESLRNQIVAGDIPNGMRLPTEPELAKRFRVSIGTLRRGMERLEMEKIVRREQGRGTFAQAPNPLEAKAGSDFIFGCALCMRLQKELNELYFGDTAYKQIVLPSPTAIRPEISKQWQDCSLVQLPMTMFGLPELNNYLSPLPEEFVREAEAVVPQKILSECRTIDGQLRLIPTVANPTVCYCWKPGFEKAGLPLPDQQKNDWNSFLDIVRKLTSANHRPGFGVMPFPGLFYELLLWGLGGDFYDDYGTPWVPAGAFRKMIALLRALYRERICYNPIGQAVTENQFFNEPKFCMTFYGPLAIPAIARPDEWHICPIDSFSDNLTASTVIGLGIPNNAPDAPKAIKLLRRVFIDQRAELLSRFTGETPGSIDALDLWTKRQRISGAGSFKSSILKSRPLAGRTGYANWYSEVYGIIDEAAKNMLDTELARARILKILNAGRIHYRETAMLA